MNTEAQTNQNSFLKIIWDVAVTTR
jgi:hypothetical protein